MLKTLLIWPPQYGLYMPFLSIPTLTAFLKQRGLPVDQRDLNIEINKTFLERGYLERCIERIDARKGTATNADDRVAFEKAIATGPETAAGIEGTIRDLRDADVFYDEKAVLGRFDALSRAYDLVSLAHSPSRVIYDFEMRWSPLHAPDVLEAVSDEDGNPYIPIFRERVVPSILAGGYGVVGISMTFESQVIPALTLAKLLKEADPSIFIIVGGGMMAKYVHRVVENKNMFKWIDAGVAYEGESALAETIERLSRGERDFTGIKNLLWRKGEQTAEGPLSGPVVAEQPWRSEDLNALPTPDFTGFPIADGYITPEPIIPILTSRGCYWGKCAFCTHSLGYLRYRLRKESLFLDDIRKLRAQTGGRVFYLVDEAVPYRQCRAFSDYVQNEAPEVRWYGDIKFEKTLTRECAEHFARGGCRMLIFGLESVSQRILDLIEKGTNAAELGRMLRDVHEVGIETVCLFFTGFPTETKEEALSTFEFIKKNRDVIDHFANCAFSLEEDSRVFKEPERYGVVELKRSPTKDLAAHYEYRVERGITATAASHIAQAITRYRLSDTKYGRSFSREVAVLYAARR